MGKSPEKQGKHARKRVVLRCSMLEKTHTQYQISQAARYVQYVRDFKNTMEQQKQRLFCQTLSYSASLSSGVLRRDRPPYAPYLSLQPYQPRTDACLTPALGRVAQKTSDRVLEASALFCATSERRGLFGGIGAGVLVGLSGKFFAGVGGADLGFGGACFAEWFLS